MNIIRALFPKETLKTIAISGLIGTGFGALYVGPRIDHIITVAAPVNAQSTQAPSPK